MNATQLTGITNTGDALHAIYMSAPLMREWIESEPQGKPRLKRALHCLSVARNPMYRHRLETVPAATIAEIETVLAETRATIAPVVAYVHALRAAFYSWRVVWRDMPACLEYLGFGPGDEGLFSDAPNESIPDDVFATRATCDL